jgi:hypothetical protein
MPRIRQVDDVSIVDWGPELSVIGEVRSLVEAGTTRRLLLNMSGCDGLRADHLETLTEAFTVCEDRGCQLGMFGVSDSIQRLIDVMELAGDLPPIVGKAEQEALASLRGGVKAAAENGKQAQQPIIDFDLDPAHAPTARFDPSQVAAQVSSASPASAATASGQTDDDLLGIDWTPLVAAGYEIGGHDAKRIVAMVGPLPPQSATTPPPVSTPSTSRPTAASRRAAVIEDDVIDLGDVAPARVPVGGDRRTFKTDVLPAFDLENVERDLAERAPTRVLGGPPQVDGDDFSPVDTTQGPPAFLRNKTAHPTPPTHSPAVHSHPTPTTPTPAQRPSVDRKSERYGAGRPAAAAAAQAPQPAPRATPPAADQGGAVNPYYASGSLLESGDEQTVMIQPGMIDAAMLASVAMAENPAPLAAPEAPAADGEFEEETVMFQPNALDAALLAEVAAVAGPETGVAAPRVEEPPAPAPPPGIPAAAMAAAPQQDESPDGREVEMRLFVHDHALSTPLHLQVLERLVKANETTFGKNDLHLATGGAVAAVSSVLDQLVQSRLVRRTRSPRVRGGTGFILSASPQARNTLVRLLKAWQSPTSRAKVATWLQTD